MRILSTLRSSLSWLLVKFDRLKAIDVLLFIGAIIFKLYILNKYLNVQYMGFTNEDFLIELGAVLLVCFWTLLLPTRARMLVLILLNVVISFVLYADLVYYRYFQDLLSVPILMQIGQVDSLGDSITTLINIKDIWFFIDWVLIVPFAVYLIGWGRRDLKKANEHRSRLPFWRKALPQVVLSAILLLSGFFLHIDKVNELKNGSAQSLFAGNWWNLSIYNVTGALGYHAYDFNRFAERHWFNSTAVSAEAMSETEAWFNDRTNLRTALESDSLFGAYKGSNVLMLQVEALQNFMFGKSIGGKEITPVLNQLVKDSAYFSNFYHQTGQGRTSDADFLANCSLQPIQNGSVFIQNATNQFSCLPQVLKSNDYSTTVYHAYEGGFWNRNSMYYNMKYDNFYHLKHFLLDEKVGWALGDKSFFRQSMDVLASVEKPFYGFLISLTSHHPFTMPAAEKKLDVGELEGTIMGDYLQSVHYVDAAIGELVDRMKAEGVWDNTIFVIYGDHDNSITDWSLYETFLGEPLNDLQRQTILKQIPLVVHLPNDDLAGEYTDIGGQIDITPTILHLLGISTKDEYMIGTPLLTNTPIEDKMVVQRNGSWTDGELYYIPSSDWIVENGSCWNIEDNKMVDINACLSGVETSREQLKMSDTVIANDLIAEFRKQNKFEAQSAK